MCSFLLSLFFNFGYRSFFHSFLPLSSFFIFPCFYSSFFPVLCIPSLFSSLLLFLPTVFPSVSSSAFLFHLIYLFPILLPSHLPTFLPFIFFIPFFLLLLVFLSCVIPFLPSFPPPSTFLPFPPSFHFSIFLSSFMVSFLPSFHFSFYYLSPSFPHVIFLLPFLLYPPLTDIPSFLPSLVLSYFSFCLSSFLPFLTVPNVLFPF